jgi:hypothetical protein
MTISAELLKLLDVLDESGLPLVTDDLVEMFPEFFAPDAENAEERLQRRNLMTFIRNLAAQAVDARRDPGKELGPNTEQVLRAVAQVTGDDPLEAYFTRVSLAEAPSLVKRSRRLEAIGVSGSPGRRVARYFYQASSCYLHGFYDAVAVLSRAVVEAALESRLGDSVLPTQGDRDRRGYLDRLINWAKTTSVLDDETLSSAHNVRLLGNKAIHEEPVNELEARRAITDAVRILRRVYANT